MKSHLPKSLMIIMLLLLLFSPAGLACSYATPRIEVQASFQVKVASGGKTFSGVRVVLQHVEITSPTYKTTVVYSATTDERGVAQFNNIRTGAYNVAVDQLDDLGVDQVEVAVSPDHSPHDVELRWPSNNILELATISGTLFDAPTGRPAKSFDLTAVNGLAGTLVSRTQTDETGHFDLGTSAAGFYFLRVQSPSGELQADIPVVITPEGKSDISLAIEETTCGPHYAEICHAGKVVTGHLRGNVADKLNPGFPAHLMLSPVKSEGGISDQSLTADKNGDFDFGQTPYGNYELKISYSFHTPLIVSITIEPPTRVHEPLQIQLSWLDSSCADASVGSGSDVSSSLFLNDRMLIAEY